MKFPSWNDILYSIVKRYEHDLNLPDDFYKQFSKQNRRLKRNLKLLSVVEPHRLIKLMEKIKWGQPKVTESALKEVEKFKSKNSLGQNQFLTIGNSHSSNFIWIDPSTYKILNINEGNFSLNGLCAIDPSLNLYHPKDVKHVVRFGILAFFILTLKGIEFDAAQDYYQVKFRIGREDNNPIKGINSSVKVAERKCFSLPVPEKGVSNSTQHMDLWTITENCGNFDHITTELVKTGKPQWSNFVNHLFYICNARTLGIKPKDVIVLNYLDIYDQAEESRNSINKELRKVHGSEFGFNSKAFSDFSYGLNKKLSEAIKKNTVLEQGESINFERLNRVKKGKQLGLLPIPNEIPEIIIKGISPLS